ncbi:hypothetical protein K3172_05120 [Qipengyuania sp. 6B39]|uniref:hypothetical protein n=1 Tax=Qipengyuania proteolytica TaxID=2867239 RepID=UPI001C898298|nr:hypothetical protein [Qipengyuania proteolytica]MBX7495232.1 hypothetical protein [Qipengyuania proteolytica]
MDWGGPGFVVALVAISTIGWLMNNWIRARHGYSLEDEWGGKTERKVSEDATQLRSENQELRALLGKVDKRMQVLERIVTDKGYSVAAEIEALRDERNEDAGVPLDIGKKEKV